MPYIELRLTSLYFKFNNPLVMLTSLASIIGKSTFVLVESSLDGLTWILISEAVISNPKREYFKLLILYVEDL
jgi:hypothetical protein